MKNYLLLLTSILTISCDSFCTNYLIGKSLYKPSNSIKNYFYSTTINKKSTVDVRSRCDVFNDLKYQRVATNDGIFQKIIKFFNVFVVATLFRIILTVFNKFVAHRSEILFNNLWSRKYDKGLVTVSNHMSFYDDPGLWSALLPFWRVSPKRMRWSLCTEDVFFAHPFITKVLDFGNVIPLDRRGSFEQSALYLFYTLLNKGSWCHIFVEGKVRQPWRFNSDEPILGPKFKLGVGKLIAHSKNCPIVIPMYHRGMDNVLPEVILEDKKSDKASKPVSYIPRTGNLIEIYIGKPLDFSQKIIDFRNRHPGMLDEWRTTLDTLELYAEIVYEIKKSMLLLEKEANAALK